MPTLKSLIKVVALVSFIGMLVLMPTGNLAQAQVTNAVAGAQGQATGAAAVNNNTSNASAAKPAECPGLLSSGGFSCMLLNWFQTVSIWLGYLIGVVAAFFISVASSLIQVIVDMSSKIISNPLVIEGFKISLSIANLGFVLAIIVIAFTTILRVSGYETKKMLKNLVLAAVLVNFSFLIAGSIIDFGNVFGNYFLSAVSPQSGNFSKFADNLANSLNIQKLSGITPQDPKNLAGALTAAGAAYVSLFASTAAIAIFSVFLVIIFFALAFMLLARYVYIIFLLILMPMAWLSWIFPGFSKYFGMWWENFIKWTLFYPAVSFFLYLAILSSQKVGEVVKTSMTASGLSSTQSAATIANVGTNTIVAFLQVIVQVAILLGGLYAANKLGIEGASAAMGYADKTRKWIIGTAGKGARIPLTAGKAAAEYGGARPAKAGARLLSGALQSRAARWIPGAQSAAANLAALGSRKEEVEGYQKQYLAHLTKDQFESMQKHPPVGPVAKAAILAESAKRGAIGGLTEKIPDYLPAGQKADIEKKNTATLQMYVQAAKDVNPKVPVDSIPAIKEVLNVNPEFVEKLSIPKDGGGVIGIEDVVKKMRADKAAEIDKGALKNSKVVLAMNQAQISSIYRSASGSHIENMENTLKEVIRGGKGFSELENTAEALAKVQTEINEKKQTAVDDADKKALKDLKVRLSGLIQKQKDAYKAANDEQRNAFDKLKIMKQRVGNPNP